MNKVDDLIRKGVRIPAPQSVMIGDEVDTDRISGKNVIIYPGSRILGASTFICEGARLGYEAPVTVRDCQIGPDTALNGGFFKNAVFLEKSAMGSGAHVRDGTILEEQAGGAHTVGLKQTILFPFVTLGSLINFCDCFMAGGTSRKNHSEVGSSFIHFNYTPNQDKATPSLIGDVPCGVMLDQKPIFLGGQGGLVGPCRLTYGNVTAAGSICRKDEHRPDRLIVAAVGKNMNIAYRPGAFPNWKKIITNNIVYIANLLALMQWYSHVRGAFVSERFPKALHHGLTEKLSMAITERIKRLDDFILKIPSDNENKEGKAPGTSNMAENLKLRWPDIKPALETTHGNDDHAQLREPFLQHFQKALRREGKDYIRVIKSLDEDVRKMGTTWLAALVDTRVTQALERLPGFDTKRK